MGRPSLIQLRGELIGKQDYSLNIGEKTKLIAQSKWFVR
jgi:hypothetical protein